MFLDNERGTAALQKSSPLPPPRISVDYCRHAHGLLRTGNCNMVSKLGVTVIYTPEGVTAEDWTNAREAFPQPGTIIAV